MALHFSDWARFFMLLFDVKSMGIHTIYIAQSKIKYWNSFPSFEIFTMFLYLMIHIELEYIYDTWKDYYVAILFIGASWNSLLNGVLFYLLAI